MNLATLLTDNYIETFADAIIKVGQGRGNWGHGGRPGKVGGSGVSTASAALFEVGDKMPNSSQSKKWASQYQEEYNNNEDFRAAVKTAVLFAGGGFKEVASVERFMERGTIPEFGEVGYSLVPNSQMPEGSKRKVGDSTPLNEITIGEATHPLAEYSSNPFATDLETSTRSIKDANETLSAGIREMNRVYNDSSISVPLYRGMIISTTTDSYVSREREMIQEGFYNSDTPSQRQEREMSITRYERKASAEQKILNIKSGDTLELDTFTSFTTKSSIAAAFSQGKNAGQGARGKNKYARSVVIEVSPGAKGLGISRFSKWNQSEVITKGSFKVESVIQEKDIYNMDSTRIVVSQIQEEKAAKRITKDFSYMFGFFPALSMELPIEKTNKSLGLSSYIRIKADSDAKKTEFVFRNNTRKYEKEFQKVMVQYFKDQEKEALSLVNKSYSPLDSVEETLIPSIGLLRVFPKKKKVIQKGGAGSGNFGHAGIPGQVGGSTSGTGGGSLFHGTSSELVNKIKTEGLKDLYLSHSDTPNVFSATDIFIALEYGVGQAKKKGLDEVAVVVINSEGVNSREVSGTGIHISENIPPSAIRRIDIYSVSDIDKYIKRVYESDTGSQGVPVPKPKQSVSIEKSVSKDMLVVLLFTGSSKKKSYFDIETKATNNPFAGWSYKDSKWNKRLQKEGSKFISSVYEKEGSRVWKELSYQITDGLEGAFSVENPLVAEYIADYSYKFAQGVNEYTVGMLQGAMTTGMSEGLGMDGISKLIMDVFDTCTKYRSLLIARTETIRASNGGAEAAYMQSGVVEGKEWLVTEDDLTCPLCNRMAGKVKRLNENYFNLGDKLLAEGTTMVFDYEDVSFPPLHPSCRCTILPVIKETYKPKTAELFEIKYPGLSMLLKGGQGSGWFRENGHVGRDIPLNGQDKKLIEDWAWGDQPGSDYDEMRNTKSRKGVEFTKTLKKLQTVKGVTYRGVVLDSKGVTKLLNKDVKILLHSSSSMDKEIALGFMRNEMVVADKGKKGVLIEFHGNGKNINPHLPVDLQSTKEVVILSGQKYKFKSIHPNEGDHVKVVLEETFNE